ncbi:MAG TPA: FHA domain-containing protein [Kofleriaceae bacterium]|nr:FHA domain-containing protein [Kofleriaceae bacterium]
MPLRLSFESGPLAGIHIVTSAPTIRLGRDPSANDILLTNPKVSRRHALLERSVRGGYALEVMGTGPSKLNGDPIAAVGGRSTVHALSSGDRLDFGGVELVVAEAEVKLIAVSGASAGREIAIDGPVRVGRGRDCDLRLDDPGVADEHLVITSTPLGFRAEARAPALFNGAPGDTRVLAHGDELILGTTIVRFTVAANEIDPESSLATLPVVGQGTNAVGELVFIAGAAKGERIPLGDNQIILGTRVDCTFVLSDLIASPLHCAISKSPGGEASRSGDQFVATDLGSESGTYINGERIFQGTALKPGDLIAVGGHVVEARLLGGVAIAARGNSIFTTLSQALADMGPQPRFVIDGRVIKARKIAIGRAPSCDVIVDGPAVSREHCVLEWEDGFVVRDTSVAGTYIDDRRVVQQQLPPSGVLRIVDTLFRIAVRGEVCTIERADAALAQAALDVQRARAGAHASMLSRGMSVQDVHQAAGDGMRTVFRMDASALQQEIASRKKDLKRNAPAWRPSSDLARDGALRGAVALSILAAIALCGGAVFLGRGGALVNHPLSAAHASAAFTEKVQSATVCAACHTAGARVESARCAACHPGFEPRARNMSAKGHADIACATCHREHEGTPRTAGQPDRSLHGARSCGGCHTSQHAGDFAPQARVPQRLAAASSIDKLRLAAPAGTGAMFDAIPLHAAHSRVTSGGVETGIGCTACHARIDTANGGALAEANPRLACFRCHDGGPDPTRTGCERCHAREHAQAMARLAPDDAGLAPRLSAPSPAAAVGWATGLALVAGAPGLLFGTWIRLRRRRKEKEMVEELKAHPAEVVKRLVHSINDSKCVGCSMCVQACPASVLELVDHKSRVVNFDSCIQCKKCEQACAFDALRMHDADKPPPMIPMPSIDAYHETPVAGMFLVGQASGTPQVKNATNLGRAVIQRLLQQGVQPGTSRQLGCEVDVCIVGSGPAGLSAALTCIELGYSYVVLEKERAFSWTIRNYYHKGKEVMAEPHDVALEATLPHWDSSREELLGAWEELVQTHRVDIRYQHNVVDVKKEGERFNVVLGDTKGAPAGQVTAARVVIAVGTLGNPRKLGCPGDDLEKVKNSLVDPDEWTGKRILIVGGSDSAVEVVLALCAPERKNQVWFSTRGAKLEGIKPKNRKLIEDALAAGRFEMRYATAVAEVTAQSVAISFKEDGRKEELPNDVVFAMIGGNSPQKWLQQIGIPYVDKPHSWSPPRTDHLSAKTAEGLIPIQRLVRRPLPVRGQHH